MNHRITQAVIFSTITLGAVLFQTGCATNGNQRSSNTSVTLKSMERDYIDSMTQIDLTDQSLQVLISPDQPDEKKAFDKYAVNVHKMKALADRLFAHANQMNTQQKNYFEEWRMQGNAYSNPQIQALSEQRRIDLTAVFGNISEASVGVKGSLKSYISDNEQIKLYLSTDLTSKGVESITPTIQTAISDGDNLKSTIQPVLSAIKTARTELAPGGNE